MLPGTSEILMLGLLAQGLEPWPLWLVATAGNVTGSTLNWWLGRFALRFADRRWFPVGPAALERAQGWYRRWGQPSLLLSWLPGVGDAFTVAAGVMRVPHPALPAHGHHRQGRPLRRRPRRRPRPGYRQLVLTAGCRLTVRSTWQATR